MFKGSYTALITPFRDGEIDDRAFQDLVDWQIREGSDGLVPVGTTGESPTLSHEEHERIVELCVEAAAGRVPIIAGTGSNSTAEAVRLTKHAKAAGADGALVVMPYYNKPTPEGQYRHFAAVAAAADIPIVIYNIPGRSVVDMSPQTMARLAQISNIVGVKDATSDPVRPTVTRLTVGKNFCQLSGEDGSVLAFLAHGGAGCISVTANIAPAQCAAVHEAWQSSDTELAMELHESLMPLHQSLFVETSPGPVKYAAAQLGLCTGEMRLPMTEVSGATKEKVRSALAAVGLLEAEKTEWRAAT